jgi:hypothetical protein
LLLRNLHIEKQFKKLLKTNMRCKFAKQRIMVEKSIRHSFLKELLF